MDCQLLIIGGGAAGLAAAGAARRSGLAAGAIVLVDRLDALGGILPQCLHHGFGRRQHGGSLSGPQFLAPLLAEFASSEVRALLKTTVTSIAPYSEPYSEPCFEPCFVPSKNGKCPQPQPACVRLAGPHGIDSLHPKAIVLATGCRERTIGSLPMAGSRPSGIFTAGAAQRMVNLRGWSVGKRIVILGSGDVGMIMAGTFVQRGKQVLAVVEQASKVGGLAINKQRYLDANGIALLTNSTITQVFGSQRLSGVEVNGCNIIDCDTLIVSVGLIPEVDLLPPAAEAAECPGIFLTGNARRIHSFIQNVVLDGQNAGKQAAEYLRA